jgi:hypothetical protein
MTLARTIEIARQHGISPAYARVMAGAIRASLSARSANAIRNAISEDMAEHLFLRLDTDCPVAA